MARRYNYWGGNPKGTPEDTFLCIVSVHEPGRGALSYQCLKKRGKGPDGSYCGQHAAMLAKGRALYVPRETE